MTPFAPLSVALAATLVLFTGGPAAAFCDADDIGCPAVLEMREAARLVDLHNEICVNAPAPCLGLRDRIGSFENLPSDMFIMRSPDRLIVDPETFDMTFNRVDLGSIASCDPEDEDCDGFVLQNRSILERLDDGDLSYEDLLLLPNSLMSWQ